MNQLKKRWPWVIGLVILTFVLVLGGYGIYKAQEAARLVAEKQAAIESHVNPGDVLRQVYDAEFSNQEEMSFIRADNAKGNAQALLKESTDKEGNPVSLMLVYDRKSKNEKCNLVALEQITYEQVENARHPINTEILDIYAVVQADGTVISSGKTDWGAKGSPAFNDATGE